MGFIEFFATAGFAKKFPRGPGTYGTVVAIPLVYLVSQTGPLVYMAITLAITIFAVIISQSYEDLNGTHDPKEVVIDEIAGFFVSMTWLPQTWQSYVLGFILFRVIDIVKPFPISVIDQKVKGGVGVVADDIAAGILTNVILQSAYSYTHLLGVQL